MAELPFFSVIVPTHKRASLLRRCLGSIKAQAVDVAVEILVISDATDADTDAACAELLTGADLYARRNGAPGPSASRNLGLSLAKGHYIIFLDDDDAWHDGFLAALLAQPAVRQGLPVYFNCSIVNERRGDDAALLSEGGADLAGRLDDGIYLKNQIPVCCFAFPRALLAGLAFDTHMRAYEDWDFMLAVYSRQQASHVPVMGARIFKDSGAESERRGVSQQSHDYNAVFDYLYVYRRHAAPTPDLSQQRAALLNSFSLPVTPDMV
ncbi:glycosyltransferase family 2 protein [Nitrospirillum iridis]|uniref:Glycosyltransferase involved in cell wall biosynthesis n=1 Tax=Nitrospirillum iridis TaxID=765888 RepID=A0A7X0AUJ5_9PROT|nr:glycosyltransferase family 2 protein [Nitrospirillum iridis]MBB6250369.1 glycosyltransferase involved in cell wall biosynthesis [Nitrospirillum iridis]